MTMAMSRRAFLAASGGAAVAVSLGPPSGAQAQAPGEGLYGALAQPDGNGLRLPEGFSSRVLATSGEPVGGSGYQWHIFPDGGATFALPAGGWVYVSNCEQIENGKGGVGALRFDDDGEVVDAYRILDDTLRNCAGGPTPWGTWLSCEEHDGGRVWECDPTGEREAEVRPAMGTFSHEAAAVDPDGQTVYLTEDQPDGRLYRFTPSRWPDLDDGTLEVARVRDGRVDWLELPDPTAASTPTRSQVAESTPFVGGEGIWFAAGTVSFVTKGDSSVWQLDTRASSIRKLYEPAGSDPVLDGPDNITVTSAGELFVCEDHEGEQDLVTITDDGTAGRLLRMTGQPGSELAGVAMAPAGDRLYLSSQRGGPGGSGITYEIAGPFHRPGEAAPPATISGPGPPPSPAASDGGDGGLGPWPVIGGVGALLVVAAAGVWRLRTRPAADESIESVAESTRQGQGR